MAPRLSGSISSLQDRLATLLGCNPSARQGIIAGMLYRNPSESAGYWLQLVVSVAIATFGLVLGSSAVVIGAMLIAPLMGPIVTFGMGLATGSPFLVLRSGARIVLSVVVAVGSSALLVRFLPFHEINAEIAARTTPTALDLLTAAFCALAGVYASMRPGSDVASTAAGTSIGISLVPPLCASGYGLGTAMWSVASGAALLFLTNLVAIVVVGTVSFMAAGFNQVNVQALEREELGTGSDSRVVRQLARVFASRGGPWLRLLMPFVVLAAVYVPLRQALDEVAWQIRVRGAVQDAVARLPHRVVQSKARVERGEVDVAVVLLGSTSEAESSRAQLDAELRQVAGVKPRLEVFAVPDATAFAGLEAALRSPAPAVPVPPSPAVQLDAARRLVHAAVERRWPRQAAGNPLLVSMTASAAEAVRVEVVHLGAPLDASAREALEKILSEDLERTVTLADVAIPPDEIGAAEGDLAFIARVAPLLEITRSVEAVSVCVTKPPEPAELARDARDARIQPLGRALLRQEMLRLMSGHPRLSGHEGEGWRIRFVTGACPEHEPVGAGSGETRVEPHSAD